MKVSKQTIIKAMSDRARSLARQFELDMSLSSVQIGEMIWKQGKKQ